MITRREKKKKRILDALSKAELSTNRGKFERSQFTKPNKKVRRHSGRKYPKIFGPQRILDEEGIFVDYYWDDWGDYRDCWRHSSDKTHFFRKWRGCCLDEEEVYKINKKIKKQIAIRKAKKRKSI